MEKVKQTRFSFTLPAIVCGLGALFYLYEFILQVSPGVMTESLMRDFKVDAAGLGIMASCYFYTYCFMQIPAGLMFDRYGPRRLMTIAIIACALGAMFFAITDSVMLAALGRFAMGFGSAFSYIGVLVLLSRWFPPQYFAMLAGMAQLIGAVGSLFGTAPLAVSVAHYGWRVSMNSLAMIGFILAVFVWLIVRDHPEAEFAEMQKPETGNVKEKLANICKNPQSWWVYLYAFCAWAPMSIFPALWGVPYIQRIYEVSTTAASGAISMVWLGVGIGSPLIGWWSDTIKRRKMPLVVSALIGVLSTSYLLFVPDISWVVLYIVLFFFGLASSGQALSFAVVKDNNNPNVVGTAMGFNNMAPIMGGAVFQPVASILLSSHWNGDMLNGVPQYSVSDFQSAMMIIPIIYLIGTVASLFFIHETRNESQY